MFIGGSPGGTAGGVKTVTVTLLAVAVISMVQSREDVEMGRRRIPMDTVLKGACIILIQAMFLLISIFALSCIESDMYLIDIMYEVFSALGTVGLTRGVTPAFSLAGKPGTYCEYVFRTARTDYDGAGHERESRKKKIHRQLPEGKIFV